MNVPLARIGILVFLSILLSVTQAVSKEILDDTELDAVGAAGAGQPELDLSALIGQEVQVGLGPVNSFNDYGPLVIDTAIQDGVGPLEKLNLLFGSVPDDDFPFGGEVPGNLPLPSQTVPNLNPQVQNVNTLGSNISESFLGSLQGPSNIPNLPSSLPYFP